MNTSLLLIAKKTCKMCQTVALNNGTFSSWVKTLHIYQMLKLIVMKNA